MRSDRLLLLVTTREEPEQLVAVLESAQRTAANPASLEVLLYVDDDDQKLLKAVEVGALSGFDFPVTPFVYPRPVAAGDIANRLAATCRGQTGVVLPIPDDYLFGTIGWDERLRDAYWTFPNHTFMAYPVDPIVPRDQVTFAFLSLPWVNALGRVSTDKFPYWFDDNWLDEVAQMVQRKMSLDMVMLTPAGLGKTRRMRNLPFWQNYYNCTFDERLADADTLRGVIWREDPQGIEASRRRAEGLYPILAASGSTPDDNLRAMERGCSPNWNEKPEAIPQSYWDVEAQAVRTLRQKAERYLEQGDVPRAIGMLATSEKAYRKIDDSSQRLAEVLRQHPRAFRGNIVETQYRPLLAVGAVVTDLDQLRRAPQTARVGRPGDVTRLREEALTLGRQAVNYLNAGELRLAEGLLRTAILTDPGTPDLHMALAVVLGRRGRTAAAIEAAHRELRDHPENADGAAELIRNLGGTVTPAPQVLPTVEGSGNQGQRTMTVRTGGSL